MKRWLAGIMAAVMAVSLAACTPTTEKQKDTTKAQTEAVKEGEETLTPATTGGAEDKVPDPNVMPVAIISIYHKGDGDSIVQDMDSLDTEGLDAQLLVDKLVEYKVLTEGTQVLNFDIQGDEENASATLDLNQMESAEDAASDAKLLTEVGNTFIENFELNELTLKVNGETVDGGNAMTYNADYEDVE